MTPTSDRAESAGSAGADPAGDPADLRATVDRLRRTIDQQRAEIDALRKLAGAAPTDERRTTLPVAESPSPTPSVARHRVAPPTAGADYTIVFDGGAIGNPGRGYGSYQVVGPSGLVAQRRVEYGDGVTNNQAEYRTLVEALEDLRDRLGRDAERVVVAVRGDSQLVVNQVTGRWKVKHPELRPLHRQVVELLRGFASSDVAWHRRDVSVRFLGH